MCARTWNPFSEPHFKRLKQNVKKFRFVGYSFRCWFLVIVVVVVVRFENDKDEQRGRRKKQNEKMQTKNNKIRFNRFDRNYTSTHSNNIIEKLDELFMISNEHGKRRLTKHTAIVIDE